MMNRDLIFDEVLLLLPALSRGLGRPWPKEMAEIEEIVGHEFPVEGVGGSISVGHVQILISLAKGPRSVGHLAESVGVSPPAATQLVDRLVEHGMVERRPDEKDRRVVLVDYVPQMRGIARRIVESRKERLESTFASLTDEEAEAFLKGLKLLAEGFGVAFGSPGCGEEK
ncbi:MAG: MarR family winged helix-turn-helix transcriptional regulator [Rubrobacteraceae bacterium]|jgi:DNA-binding MarR family transcriptional regulator